MNSAIESSRREKPAPFELTVSVAQVVIRVSMIIAIWLALCLSVFLGFFTVPLLMLMAFALVYFLFDLHRVLRRAISARRKRATSDDGGHS